MRWNFLFMMLAVLCIIAGCGSQAETKNATLQTCSASIISYEVAAVWDHYGNDWEGDEAGKMFESFDVLKLRLDEPKKFSGIVLTVQVDANELPDNSPFRNIGARIQFELDREYLNPISNVFWDALKSPRLVD